MKPYFQRTKQEHDAERTRHLYMTIRSTGAVLQAESYMLPLETTAACARIQPGEKYKVIFRLPDQNMVVIQFKNLIDCDEVEIVDDLEQFAGPIIVAETKADTKAAPAPVEEQKPVQSKDVLAKTANEWWKAYSEKLWSEITLVGEQTIILGKEYRLPCQEILPYLDRKLRKESNGRFGFDSIDDDLIGLVTPLSQEQKEQLPSEKPKQQSKKPQKMSQVDKFNQRQQKKAQ